MAQFFASLGSANAPRTGNNYFLRPQEWTQVRLLDGFWSKLDPEGFIQRGKELPSECKNCMGSVPEMADARMSFGQTNLLNFK
jgi:hypothetical protein